MLMETTCVLHTQIPRALQAEPNKLRFKEGLLGLDLFRGKPSARTWYQSQLSNAWSQFEPLNRDRAPSMLSSFVDLH